MHKAFLGELVYRFFAGMSEGGVAKVVAKACRVCNFCIQLPACVIKALAYGFSYGCNMEHMLNACAYMVILRCEKGLRFVLKPPECAGMYYCSYNFV